MNSNIVIIAVHAAALATRYENQPVAATAECRGDYCSGVIMPRSSFGAAHVDT